MAVASCLPEHREAESTLDDVWVTGLVQKVHQLRLTKLATQQLSKSHVQNSLVGTRVRWWMLSQVVGHLGSGPLTGLTPLRGNSWTKSVRTTVQKPWNDDSPANTKEQWAFMVSKWCRSPQYALVVTQKKQKTKLTKPAEHPSWSRVVM